MMLHKKPKYYFNYLNWNYLAFSGIYCSVRNVLTCTPSAQPRYIKNPGITEIYPALRYKKKLKKCTLQIQHRLVCSSNFPCLLVFGGQGTDTMPAWRIMTNSFKKPEIKYQKFIPYVVSFCSFQGEDIFRERVGKLGTIALAVSENIAA